MLGTLVLKDLRRIWRNPLPALINLALPLCIAAAIGLAFGSKSDRAALEHIRFAVVNEDQSELSGLLRTAMASGQNEHLEPVFLDRETALRQINSGNLLSGVVIVPTNFCLNYISGKKVELELIKNPAQAIQPAVLEELAGIFTASLNAVAENFGPDLSQWRATVDAKTNSISAIMEGFRTNREKFDRAKPFVDPPLVAYEEGENSAAPANISRSESSLSQTRKAQITAAAKSDDGASMDLFGRMLVGMSGMFLFFLAGHAMTDLLREVRFRTFQRYRTLRVELLPFIAGKVLFAVVFLLLCTAILLGGGGLIFGIQWRHPVALIILAVAYACCVAGIATLLTALSDDERRAATLHNAAAMAFGLFGGCMIPVHSLPQLVSGRIAPLLPSFWFVDTTGKLQSSDSAPWGWVSLGLLALSVVLIAWSVARMHRRFREGLRA